MRFNINITTRLLGYLFTAGIVPLVVLGLASFEIVRGIIIEQAATKNARLVTNLQAYYRMYADQVESLAANIAGNEAIATALYQADHTPDSRSGSFAGLNARAQIGYTLNSYVRVKGLVAIDLFSAGGQHFHVGDTLATGTVDAQRLAMLREEAEAAGSQVTWRGIEDNLNSASPERQVLTITRTIRRYAPESGRTETVGLLVINLNDEALREYQGEAQSSGELRLLLADRHGHLIYHSERALQGQPLQPALLALLRDASGTHQLQLDGEAVLLTSQPVARLQGVLAVAEPRHGLTVQLDDLRNTGLLLLLAGVVLISLLALHFRRYVVTPVRGVSNGFRRLAEEPEILPAPLPVATARDELSDLVSGFNAHLQTLAKGRTLLRDLEQARLAAETANVAKSAFLANMSHEIRTPMNAILGMMQLALDAQQTDERREFIRKAHRAAEHLLSIINDILDVSKIEAGKLAIERVAFALTPLAADLTDVFTPAAHDKGLDFQITLAPDLPDAIWGDPLRLRQILQNLIGNALKFTEQGHVVVAITQQAAGDHSAATATADNTTDSATDIPRCLHITVSDSGIGISAAEQARLFQPFVQADDSTTRRFGGTGLGLTISKRLVELMGGRIGVDSQSGTGSTFWFELPCQAAPATAVHSDDMRHGLPESPGSSQSGPDERLRERRILLVEDNRLNQEVARHFLAKAGIDTHLAENGADALAALMAFEETGKTVDWVLMDCQMPVMDGYEASRLIRADGRWAQLPIIAMTANALVGDRERSLDAGMNEHLTKPLNPNLLYRTLLHWLVPAAPTSTVPSASPATAPLPHSPADTAPSTTMAAASPATTDQAAQQSVPPLLDSSTALTNLGGDAALYAEVAQVFLDDSLRQLAYYDTALASGDFVTARRVAHTLKGTAAAMGAERLRHAAFALERACSTADRAAIVAVEAAFRETLADSRDALQAWLAAR